MLIRHSISSSMLMTFMTSMAHETLVNEYGALWPPSFSAFTAGHFTGWAY